MQGLFAQCFLSCDNGRARIVCAMYSCVCENFTVKMAQSVQTIHFNGTNLDELITSKDCRTSTIEFYNRWIDFDEHWLPCPQGFVKVDNFRDLQDKIASSPSYLIIDTTFKIPRIPITNELSTYSLVSNETTFWRVYTESNNTCFYDGDRFVLIDNHFHIKHSTEWDSDSDSDSDSDEIIIMQESDDDANDEVKTNDQVR